MVVIEEGIRTTLNSSCTALKDSLAGRHTAHSKYVLKKGASLTLHEFQKWGKQDTVQTRKEFYLGRSSTVDYVFKNFQPPSHLKMEKQVYEEEGASTTSKIVINGIDAEVELADTILLKERDAKGTLTLRLVGRKHSTVTANSTVIAEGAGKGHLDCQGLLVDEGAQMRLIPELDNRHREALITHEASIGRISEEELNYLRSRGLTEQQATDLIVSGFLE